MKEVGQGKLVSQASRPINSVKVKLLSQLSHVSQVESGCGVREREKGGGGVYSIGDMYSVSCIAAVV